MVFGLAQKHISSQRFLSFIVQNSFVLKELAPFHKSTGENQTMFFVFNFEGNFLKHDNLIRKLEHKLLICHNLTPDQKP